MVQGMPSRRFRVTPEDRRSSEACAAAKTSSLMMGIELRSVVRLSYLATRSRCLAVSSTLLIWPWERADERSLIEASTIGRVCGETEPMLEKYAVLLELRQRRKILERVCRSQSQDMDFHTTIYAAALDSPHRWRINNSRNTGPSEVIEQFSSFRCVMAEVTNMELLIPWLSPAAKSVDNSSW